MPTAWLILAETIDDPVWSAQEPGPSNLKVHPLGWEVEVAKETEEIERGGEPEHHS